MQKLKILQLINVRWYNACAYFAISQAKALADRGHDVILMADPHSPPAVAAKKWGLTTDTSINFSKTSLTAINVARFLSYVKNTRPDIIVAHRGESHMIAALAVRLSGLRLPVMRYRGDVRFARTSILSKWLNKRLTAGVGVSTEKQRQFYLDNFGIKSVRLIHPGIDTSFFKPRPRDKNLARRHNIRAGEVVIGMIGRLDLVKGHRFFIEAAKIISIEEKNVKFIIAGKDEGVKSDDLKKMAGLLGFAGRFAFIGQVDDIRPVLSLMDIGVVASTGSESICRVALEYMASGIPVVGTDINQIPEIIGKCGILVPAGDPVTLAKALRRLIGDRQLRDELAGKSLARIKNRFSLDQLGKNSENYLLEILNGAS